MATISNGESGSSVRTKLNDIINKVEGVTSINNNIDVTGTVTADGVTVGDTSASASRIFITSSSIGESELRLGDTDTDAGSIAYQNSSDTMEFRAAAGVKMSLNSSGLDVTGTVTADGLTVDGDVTIADSTPSLTLSDADGTDQTFTLTHNSATSTFDVRNNISHGNIVFRSYNGTSYQNKLRLDNSGDISFYEDTGITAKFFWDASYESLDIGSGLSESVKNFGTNTKLGLAGSIILEPGSGNEVDIFNYRTTNLNLGTGGSADLTIDGSGNVGIKAAPVGYAAVLSALQLGGNANIVAESSTGASQFLHISQNANFDADASWEYISTDEASSYYQNNGTHVWRYAASGTAGTDISWSEAMRIDGSGNLLVGTTATNLYLSSDGSEGIRIAEDHVSVAGDQRTLLYLNRQTTDGEILRFNKDGATVGSIGSYSGTDTYVTGGSGNSTGIVITSGAIVPSGSAGATNTNVNLGLSATGRSFKDLYLSGDTFVGEPSTIGAGETGVTVRGLGQIRVGRAGTASVTLVSFNNDNGEVGTIVTSGSATAYNTSSDYRLKTDAQPMTGATDRLKQLNPVNFEWIADGTRVDGFLAHEAQAIVPEAVTGAKDAMRDEEYEVTPAVLDDDGNVVTEAVMGTRSVPDYQGIDQSKLVPLLVATIKELEARITALENA